MLTQKKTTSGIFYYPKLPKPVVEYIKNKCQDTQLKEVFGKGETKGALLERLSKVGFEINKGLRLSEIIPSLLGTKLENVVIPSKQRTFPKITSAAGNINWKNMLANIGNQNRALCQEDLAASLKTANKNDFKRIWEFYIAPCMLNPHDQSSSMDFYLKGCQVAETAQTCNIGCQMKAEKDGLQFSQIGTELKKFHIDISDADINVAMFVCIEIGDEMKNCLGGETIMLEPGVYRKVAGKALFNTTTDTVIIGGKKIKLTVVPSSNSNTNIIPKDRIVTVVEKIRSKIIVLKKLRVPDEHIKTVFGICNTKTQIKLVRKTTPKKTKKWQARNSFQRLLYDC
mmetsp:Transcript_29638/g.33026  ORF Transcript_29638/g.33026 Transcript_29638/m.33026 type:complete len:341 (+) Transcript_29638:2-1024(+)